jgi:hypothetical protein
MTQGNQEAPMNPTPPLLVADYHPGLFESTLLVRALATGAVGYGAAFTALVMPTAPLAWLCILAAVCLLVSGCLSWWAAFQTLRTAGPRAIDLSRRLITFDGERRFLAGSILEIEDTRLGRWASRRLTIAWPDGRRLPLAQGPARLVDPLWNALCA